MNSNRQTLTEKFKDEEYRHEYTEAFFDTLVATQIRALRNRKGWSQSKLGEAAGTTQSGISAFESSDYSRWSVATLRRLARIFDVAVEVRFVSFKDALRAIEDFASADVEVPAYADLRFVGETAGPSHVASEGVYTSGQGSTEMQVQSDLIGAWLPWAGASPRTSTP